MTFPTAGGYHPRTTPLAAVERLRPAITPASRPRTVVFYTVAEVALMMRVSKMTVYRLVHSGELEAVRIGRSFRIPERAVDAMLKQLEVVESAPAAS